MADIELFTNLLVALPLQPLMAFGIIKPVAMIFKGIFMIVSCSFLYQPIPNFKVAGAGASAVAVAAAAAASAVLFVLGLRLRVGIVTDSDFDCRLFLLVATSIDGLLHCMAVVVSNDTVHQTALEAVDVWPPLPQPEMLRIPANTVGQQCSSFDSFL